MMHTGMRYGDTTCTSEGDLGGLPDSVEETALPTTIRHNRVVKYRTRVEKWIVESISNQYDYDDPAYPGELLDTVYDFEDRIMRVLIGLSDDDLVDTFYQHSCGYTFEELLEDIEHEFMQENTTCIITRADRIRLNNVDKNKSSMKNFKTVMDLYERARMTPEQIDTANPSEVFEAEHVIELVLEVLHDTMPGD